LLVQVLRNVLISLLLLGGSATGCTSHPDARQAIAPAKVAALTKDFDTWYTYASYNVILARDFTGLDTLGQPLPKLAFLRRLASGRALALVNGSLQHQPIYQLCALPSGCTPAVVRTSQQLAEAELFNFARHGQPLPAFDFVDLQGERYTPATTRGKLVVLKACYIGCLACVDEFPAVNALVDQYRGHPDVVFISLAMDPAPALRAFLRDHPVRFAVVPASKAYLRDSLHLQAYPTHLLLGRDGKIITVTNRATDLAFALRQAVTPAR
jgi:peroxiredoxin